MGGVMGKRGMPVTGDPITELPGVGEARAGLFERLGIRTTEDLLWHLPRRYEWLLPWDGSSEGEWVATGRLGKVRLLPGRRVEAELLTGDVRIRLQFYGKPYLARSLRTGAERSVFGRVERASDGYQIIEPEFLSGFDGPLLRPVYPLTEGLGGKVLSSSVMAALKRDPAHPLRASFWKIHRPQNDAEAEAGRQELKAVEASSVARAVADALSPREARPFPPEGALAVRTTLPFELRPDQVTALRDVLEDMARPLAMRRVLLGEVGSGKTVVSLLAASAVLEGGANVLFLCPTALLLGQHLETARQVLGDRFSVVPVGAGHGRPPDSLDRPALVIGTTAALGRPELLDPLGLVIVDEEQRFGVRQREGLLEGTPSRHLLTLSATPIPRTMAQALASRLGVSTLGHPYGGLAPVEILETGKRKTAYQAAYRACREGGQAIVICPRLREGDAKKTPPAEGLYAALKASYPSLPMALITGETEGRAVEEILSPFREGRPGLLVGTSVLEVGLDLPRGEVLIVEGAQAFGLAQLHQMRGRVGRRGQSAQAYWICDGDQVARDRLGRAARAKGGEEVAELDLAERGPGLLEGLLQHGFPPTRALQFPTDLPLVFEALSRYPVP